MQKKLEHLKANLALLRSADVGAADLSRRIEEMQQRLDHLKAEFVLLREQSGTLPPAISPQQGCCRFRGVAAPWHAQRGTQVSGANCCDASPSSTPVVKSAGVEPLGNRTIESKPLRDLILSLKNDPGRFVVGQNSFCLEFKKEGTEQPADVGDVQVEFTTDGRVKVMRAVVRLDQTAAIRYCGQVTLRLNGPWHITVRFERWSDRAKVVFLAIVK